MLAESSSWIDAAFPHHTFDRRPLPDPPEDSGLILAVVFREIRRHAKAVRDAKPISSIGIEHYGTCPAGWRWAWANGSLRRTQGAWTARDRHRDGARSTALTDAPTEDLIGCVSCEDRVGCPIMLTTRPQGIANTIMVLIELRRRTRCSAPEFNLSGD
jgi:hypothetical protein